MAADVKNFFNFTCEILQGEKSDFEAKLMTTMQKSLPQNFPKKCQFKIKLSTYNTMLYLAGKILLKLLDQRILRSNDKKYI